MIGDVLEVAVSLRSLRCSIQSMIPKTKVIIRSSPIDGMQYSYIVFCSTSRYVVVGLESQCLIWFLLNYVSESRINFYEDDLCSELPTVWAVSRIGMILTKVFSVRTCPILIRAIFIN